MDVAEFVGFVGDDADKLVGVPALVERGMDGVNRTWFGGVGHGLTFLNNGRLSGLSVFCRAWIAELLAGKPYELFRVAVVDAVVKADGVFQARLHQPSAQIAADDGLRGVIGIRGDGYVPVKCVFELLYVKFVFFAAVKARFFVNAAGKIGSVFVVGNVQGEEIVGYAVPVDGDV